MIIPPDSSNWSAYKRKICRVAEVTLQERNSKTLLHVIFCADAIIRTKEAECEIPSRKKLC